MEVVEDQAQRALLAEALLAETRPPEEREVASAIQEIQERTIENRLRDVRHLLAEASGEETILNWRRYCGISSIWTVRCSSCIRDGV